MSPSRFGVAVTGFWGNCYVDNLGLGRVNDSRGVRPVLSLKSDISVIGSGTQNDPWIVQ